MDASIIISKDIETGELLFDFKVEFDDKQIYTTPIGRVNEPSKEFIQIMNELNEPGN